MRSLKKDENALKLIALVAKKRIRSERERFNLHHSKNNNIIAHKAYITHWVNIHSITIINSITAALQIVYTISNWKKKYRVEVREEENWKWEAATARQWQTMLWAFSFDISYFRGRREWTERLFFDFHISHCDNQFSSLFLWELVFHSWRVLRFVWVG